MFCEDITQWLYDSDVHNYDELDQLFLDAGNSLESAHTENTGNQQENGAVKSACACTDFSPSHVVTSPPTNPPDNSSSTPINSSRFAPPKTEAEIIMARKAGIPKRTQQDTKYCTKVWDEWRQHRQQTTGVQIRSLHLLPPTELAHWLTRFVLEARKKTGEVYPPNTLHHICCGLMRYLRQSGMPEVDFFKDPSFSEFRASLDAEMKRLQGEGYGSTKKQAEVLTEEEENSLWEKKLLGDYTPQTLLDTIVFYNGLFFALRSGQEHRQLRRDPCQIQVVEHPGERPYLKYTEDISKNRPGGLKGKKTVPKVVCHHANTENPQRCFVRLFKLYLEKCPANAPPHALYLRPASTPTATCWYSKCPLGHTTLSKTVARLCQECGIPGYKTNHSLRATVTSRLYRSGVDEQLVMERTGHCSVEGVRSYKRTSDTQREALSDILNQQKRPRSTSVPSSVPLQTTSKSSLQPVPVSDNSLVANSQHNQQLVSGLSIPSATFNNCTVNFYMAEPSNTGIRDRPKLGKRRAIIESDSDSD